jgi:ribosome-binding factor A
MPRSDDSAGHRHARLEDVILGELRSLFRDDVSDPDLRHVRAHYVLSPEEGPPSPVRLVEARLRRATPFLRARLAEAIELKRLPDLTFVFDAATPAGDAP